MASHLRKGGNFTKFLELARIYEASVCEIPDGNPVKKPLENLGSVVEEGFGQLKNEFNKIDWRFDEINRRFDKIDRRFDKIDRRFEIIDHRLSGFMGKDPSNNMAGDFEQMMFYRATVVFPDETFEFRRKIEDEKSTKHGVCKLSLGEIDIFGQKPPRIIEASLCLRESDLDDIEVKRHLLHRFNLVPSNAEIHAHMWCLWFDKDMEQKLRALAERNNVDIVTGNGLFQIDGKSIFKDE